MNPAPETTNYAQDDSLTIAEFSHLEKISVPTVYKLIREGSIDSYCIGRNRRIPPGERKKLHSRKA